MLLVGEAVTGEVEQKVVAPQDEPAEGPVHRLRRRQLKAVDHSRDLAFAARLGRVLQDRQEAVGVHHAEDPREQGLLESGNGEGLGAGQQLLEPVFERQALGPAKEVLDRLTCRLRGRRVAYVVPRGVEGGLVAGAGADLGVGEVLENAGGARPQPVRREDPLVLCPVGRDVGVQLRLVGEVPLFQPGHALQLLGIDVLGLREKGLELPEGTDRVPLGHHARLVLLREPAPVLHEPPPRRRAYGPPRCPRRHCTMDTWPRPWLPPLRRCQSTGFEPWHAPARGRTLAFGRVTRHAISNTPTGLGSTVRDGNSASRAR